MAELDLAKRELQVFIKSRTDAVTKMPQTQRASLDQFMCLYEVANKLGLYDAADFLRRHIDGVMERIAEMENSRK